MRRGHFGDINIRERGHSNVVRRLLQDLKLFHEMTVINICLAG